MNRIQKKCLIGAAGFHLLLLLILVIGPAFLSQNKDDFTQPITIVDLSRLTDGPTQTGGSSTPQAPPPAPAAQVVQPPTPAPAPPKADTAREVPREKPTPKEPDKETTPSVSEAPKIHVAKKVVKRNTSSEKSTSNKAETDSASAANAARQTALNRVIGNLQTGLSTGTEVSIPGPGAGTFVNYAEAVRIAYTQAWIPPADVTDDNASAKVSVTIARDGTVVSARLQQPSGSAAVDRTVEQTLRRVKFIAPFPAGATDDQRTFIINFNLKAKRLIG